MFSRYAFSRILYAFASRHNLLAKNGSLYDKYSGHDILIKVAGCFKHDNSPLLSYFQNGFNINKLSFMGAHTYAINITNTCVSVLIPPIKQFCLLLSQ